LLVNHLISIIVIEKWSNYSIWFNEIWYIKQWSNH